MTNVILVTGAGGLTGGEVVRQLIARGARVRALVRAPDRPVPAGAERVIGDLGDPASLVEPLRGVDRAMLISSSRPDMQQVQTTFVHAAARAGVRHLVKLSGIMPDLDSPFRFARMHGEVERVIAASGMAWTQLRAGEFMHAYFRQVPSIVNKRALALPMADARIACVDIDDIARAAAIALTTPGHDDKVYPITGGEALTMTEVAAVLSAVVGAPVRYVDVPPEDARRAQLAAGFAPYLADALFELFAERRAGKEARVWPTLPEVFGITPTPFAAFAARHAAVFRGEVPPPAV
jgi:uncharacterized protein YbjT (DUF2867 family)